MRIRGIIWLEDIVDKLAEKHGVVESEVRDVFASRPAFRRMEKKVLESLRKAQNRVISLGGGSIMDPDNRSLARRLGKIVWLRAPAAVLWSRIAQVLIAMSAAAPDAAPGLAPESAAMRGVRYEDVDAETLAQEERTPIFIGPASVRTAPAGPIPQRARAPKRYGFVRAPGPAGNGRPDGAAAPALAQAA